VSDLSPSFSSHKLISLLPPPRLAGLQQRFTWTVDKLELAFPAFKLVLRDASGRATTSQGDELRVELSIPGVVVKYQGSAFTALSSDGSEKKRRKSGAGISGVACGSFDDLEGVIFRHGDWVASLPKSPPLLDPEAVSTKEVQGSLVVSWVGTSFPPHSFDILIQPGLCREIELIEPELVDRLELVNNCGLPTLLFRCLDVGGNMTAPRPGETWNVELRVDESDGSITCLPDGTQSRKSGAIKVGSDGTFAIEHHLIQSAWKKETLEAKRVDLVISVLDPNRTASMAIGEIPLEIQPQRNIPQTYRIVGVMEKEGVRPEKLVIENETYDVPISAGSVIKDLRLEILDETGSTLGDSELTIRVQPSWSDEAVEGFRLPDYLPGGPDKPDDKRYKLKAVHKLNLEVPLLENKQGVSFRAPRISFSFKVAKPDYSVRWRMYFHRNSQPDKVVSGQELDLQNLRICNEDKYGNRNRCVEALPPLLTVTGEPPLPLEGPVGDVEVVFDNGAFRVKPPAKLVYRGKAQTLTFTVRDKANKYTPEEWRLPLEAGPVKEMLIKVPSLGVSEWTATPRVQLSYGHRVEDLAVMFQDDGGYNAVAPPDGTEVLGRYSNAQQTVVLQRGNLTDAEVALGRFGFKEKGSKVLELVLIKSRTRQELAKASVEVEYFKSLRVMDVKVHFCSSPTQEEPLTLTDGELNPNELTIDMRIPWLALQFITENGTAFVPVPSAVQVHVGIDPLFGDQPGDWYEPTGRNAVLRTEAGEDKTVLAFSPLGGQRLVPGAHQIEVQYVEKRREVSTFGDAPSRFRPDFGTMRVLAGKAVELRQTGKESPRAVSNRADNARVIFQNLTIVPVDRLGRHTSAVGQFAYLRITSDDQHASDAPVLEGADDDGYLAVQGTTDPGDCTAFAFGQVRVRPGSGRSTGTFVLRCHCDPGLGLKAWAVNFSFTSDHARLAEITRIQADLKPVESRLDEIEKERSKLTDLLVRCRKAKEDTLRQIPGIVQASGQPRIQYNDLQAVQQLRGSLQQRVQAAEAQYSRRARRPHPNLPQALLADPECVGAVVDKATVDDLRLANVLAWAAGAKSMRSVIVTTSASWKRLRSHYHVTYFCVEVRPMSWLI
jgi:hypothetical protein